MSGSNLVIVESPAKAKTINKYLGPDFTVLASFGHIRDLPPKDGSVRPEEDFAMSWELGDRSKRHVDEISRAIRGVDHVFLATDPDREGEAIAWHVQEVLREAKLLDKVDVRRVTFNEITKGAVLDAMKRPRDLNRELIEAYLARRALDYLVGFTLSPVLWRKLPGSRSAGRVQSVALRLICEREAEIEVFRPQEYWSIEVVFQTAGGAQVKARLTQLDGKRLDKFALGEAGAANAVVERLKPLSYAVHSVEHKQVKRNPYPPFTTSTLQQEASRKLGMGATRTMRVAQKLYEGVDIGGESVGLITYMRTDGVQLSNDAIGQVRELIGSQYGGDYVPDSPRIYKSAAKNAQEAHEAIRPTDLLRRPDDVAHQLERDELRLYELIWKRTVASQMESAVLDQVAVDIASSDGKAVLRATGSVVLFDGFLRVYQEERDDSLDEKSAAEDEAEARLPPVKEGDAMKRGAVDAEQHFTQPPPRYTEASLVKKLEELGIGRPSTYASIVTTIQDRDYVRKEQNRLIPEDKGRLVTIFLQKYFPRYVSYDFTANLEGELDDISSGERAYREVLRRFWRDFTAALEGTSELRIGEVLEAIDEALAPHLYPPRADGGDPRECPLCHKGRLHLKTARSGGAFIGCTNYPECRFTRPISSPDAEVVGDAVLGEDNGDQISLKNGRFGPYVQRGEASAENPKPPRASIPKGWDLASVDLDRALALLALPREIGPHPEDGVPVEAGIGRYGPYVKHGAKYANLPDVDEVFTIGMNRAVEVLAQKATRGRAAPAAPLAELGEHPEGGPVQVLAGRYGPYVKWGKVNATLPRDLEPGAVTLERALELIAEKAGKSGRKPAKKPAAKAEKAPAKRASAKKPAAKKPAATKKAGARKAE